MDQTERLTQQGCAGDPRPIIPIPLSTGWLSQQGWTLCGHGRQAQFPAGRYRVDFPESRIISKPLSDFSGVYAQREQLMRVYCTTVVAAALLSGAAPGAFLAVTYPLRRSSQAANQVAAGDYERRVPAKRSSEEIRKLSEDFKHHGRRGGKNNVSEPSRKLKSGNLLWPISPTN